MKILFVLLFLLPAAAQAEVIKMKLSDVVVLYQGLIAISGNYEHAVKEPDGKGGSQDRVVQDHYKFADATTPYWIGKDLKAVQAVIVQASAADKAIVDSKDASKPEAEEAKRIEAARKALNETQDDLDLHKLSINALKTIDGVNPSPAVFLMLDSILMEK